MEIDPNIATTIVANIKDVLRHEINLFDTHGMIIASTDASRVGTYHEAAELAVQTMRTICVDDEHPYKGARNGINTPVMINDEVVAVIGVTGERSQVEGYSSVIRKMTEILLHENIEQTARTNRRIAQTNLVNQLMSEHPDEDVVRFLCAELDWDPQTPHRVALGALRTESTEGSLAAWPYDRLTGILSTADAETCCLVLPADESDDRLEYVRWLLHSQGRDASFGVSDTADHLRELPRGRRQARMALDWLRFTKDRHIMHVADLDFGLLVPELDRSSAMAFVDHVFAGLNDARIRAHRHTFATYTRFNGSVTHAADALYIHKNTMQNHLNAIARDTGYNPRILHDYGVLDMAFLLYDYLQFCANNS